MNKLSIKELEAKATACRKNARIKTGSAYEREIARAKEYEELARARKAALLTTSVINN